MPRLRSAAARFEATLLALGALLLVLWAFAAWFDWLPRLDARQHAALEWARAAPPAPAGDSAVPRLWLSGYALSDSERDRLLQLPTARLLAALAGEPQRRLSPLMTGEDAAQELQRALADPEALRTAVAAAAPVLSALPWIREAAHAGDPLSPVLLFGESSDQAMPNFTLPAIAVRQAAALEVVEGRAPQGLQRLCEDAQFWRRMLASGDTLVVRMVVAGMLRRHAALANVIDTRAAQSTWPSSCADAFSPLTPAEVDLCEPLRSEFRVLDQWTARWWTRDEEIVSRRLLAHREHFAALDAEGLAQQCGSVPGVPGAPARQCGMIERAFNFTGCTLAAIRRPAYQGFSRRLHELDATLQGVRDAAHGRRATASPPGGGAAAGNVR